MKRSIRFGILFVFSAVLAAPNVLSAPQAVTLRWATCCAQTDRHEMFQRWARKFEARHPHIKVEWSWPNPYLEKVKTQIAGGVGPDVLWLGIDYWTFYDLLLPLDELRTGSAAPLKDAYPAVFPLYSWQNRLGGAPYGANTTVMFLNKQRLQQVGLQVPGPEWTWNDAIDMAKKLTRDQNADGVPEQWGIELRYGGVMPMALSFGGPVYSADGRKALFNNPVTIAATQTLADIMSGKLGIHPVGSAATAIGDWSKQFASETTAMVAAGVWAIPFMRQNVGFDWDVAPYPGLDRAGQHYRNTFLSGEGWSILRTSQHPQEALTFVRFLLEPEQMAEFSRLGGIIPSQPAVARTAFLPSDGRPQNMRAFLDSLSFGNPLHYFHPARVQVNDAIWPTVTRVFAGDIPAATGLTQAEQAANQVLAEFWARER